MEITICQPWSVSFLFFHFIAILIYLPPCSGKSSIVFMLITAEVKKPNKRRNMSLRKKLFLSAVSLGALETFCIMGFCQQWDSSCHSKVNWAPSTQTAAIHHPHLQGLHLIDSHMGYRCLSISLPPWSGLISHFNKLFSTDVSRLQGQRDGGFQTDNINLKLA